MDIVFWISVGALLMWLVWHFWPQVSADAQKVEAQVKADVAKKV